MDHLYIRHTVGGTLFYDSWRDGSGYELIPGEKGLLIVLHQPGPEVAARLVANRDELNIFLVPDGQTERKSWLYSSEGWIETEGDGAQVRILADTRQDYTVW